MAGQKGEKSMFQGYCFKKVNGRYLPPEELRGANEAWQFVMSKKEKFAEIRVVDMDDNVVIHAIDGDIIFPSIDEMCKSKKTKDLHANVNFEGLANYDEVSADSCLEIETTCTGKTSVDVKLFKA